VGRPLAATADPLRRACSVALAHHRARAKADHQCLDYGLAELERLARRSPLCAYCRCPLTGGTLSFDHATPTSRAADYRLANVVCCCPRCNALKGRLKAEEFAGLLRLIATWPPAAGSDLLARVLAGNRRYRGA
jgi:5-methylcytosine-specific restriction endonuclease McrA